MTIPSTKARAGHIIPFHTHDGNTISDPAFCTKTSCCTKQRALCNYMIDECDPELLADSDIVSNIRQQERTGRRESKKDEHEWRCPKCDDHLWPLRVKKDSINKGRPFISCRECNYFGWLDEGMCPDCKAFPLATWTVRKNSPNKGRRFETCSSQGCGYFRWIDETRRSK